MSEQVTEQTQEAPSPAIAVAGPHPSAAQAVEGSADRDAPEGPGKLVPVNEAIKYRRRAQQAESRLQQVEQQLNDLRTQFEERLEQLATADAARDEMQHQLEAVRARASAEGALYGAGVVDIEAASALLEKRFSFDDEFDAERLRPPRPGLGRPGWARASPERLPRQSAAEAAVTWPTTCACAARLRTPN